MPKHKMNTTTKRGRIVHSPNPERPAFIFPKLVLPAATPISKKEALRLTGDTPLPSVKGVHITTEFGRRLVHRQTKVGIIKYNFALI